MSWFEYTESRLSVSPGRLLLSSPLLCTDPALFGAENLHCTTCVVVAGHFVLFSVQALTFLIWSKSFNFFFLDFNLIRSDKTSKKKKALF